MSSFQIFKGQNELTFQKEFSTKESCFDYLSHYKWRNGFKCSSCGCIEEYACTKAHHKRCKKCLHLESVTSGTLFHNVKFGIVKAFYIVFKMSATTKSISAEQLSKTVGVNRKTALLFQHKVRLAPLKKEYGIEQEKSKPKENFQIMHRCIQQLKSWIRGIHHHVDDRYLQGYLNEFSYRINRSIHKETIFDNLLERMVLHPKNTRKELIINYCN